MKVQSIMVHTLLCQLLTFQLDPNGSQIHMYKNESSEIYSVHNSVLH